MSGLHDSTMHSTGFAIHPSDAQMQEQREDSPPPGIPPEHMARTNGPRRDSCEGRPGIIESTHLAPLNEELLASDPGLMTSATGMAKNAARSLGADV